MGEGGWELLAGLLGASTEITAGVRLEEWQCLPSPDSELCFQLVRAFYSQEAAVHACLMARLKNFDDDHVFSMNIFSGGEHLRKVSRATSHSDVPTKPDDRSRRFAQSAQFLAIRRAKWWPRKHTNAKGADSRRNSRPSRGWGKTPVVLPHVER